MSVAMELDELYVVSDLHLGGSPGFQIFNQGKRLAALIDQVRLLPPNRRAAFVINGDVVDFLAESDSRYLKVYDAPDILARLMRDPAFKPVFQALAALLRTPNRFVVLVLGNHDVELALPAVRDFLTMALARDDAAARGRLIFALDGTGFEAQVGGARTLCLHGNEVDAWNTVDYERLRSITSALKRDRPTEDWQPNPGTRLVIDSMNKVKVRYPFVDLLKPETSVATRVLLALDRSTVKELTGVVKLALGVLRGKSVTSSFLGTVEPPGDTRDDDQRALEVLLGQRPGRKPPSRGDDLLRQAEEDYRNDRLPEALTDAGATETLGLPSYFYQTEVEKVAPEEALRQALQEWMAGDDTFGLTTQDETFRELDKRVGSGIDFLIAGHTHLPRAIRRKPGFYYNSGTWIRLIYLTEKLTATSEAFEPVYRALTAGSMDALDRTPGLILPLYTVVRVRDEGKMGVKGELLKVVGEPEDLRLETMPGSEFVKLAGI